MAKIKLSLEEQIKKQTEKIQLLKKKKEEIDAKKRKADLDIIGASLHKIGFNLEDTALHIGCIIYALDAIKSAPELEETLREDGQNFLNIKKESSNES